ncbi:MAG: DUF58 domain-containing protein [Chloroflexi bacterium]|nr:DUF58 domain-containing protein [Chloroflexota bacterium]
MISNDRTETDSKIQTDSLIRRTPEDVLRYLDWHVVRKLDGILQGEYRSLFYGAGLDFSDLREYVFEDDYRKIDWNVTARMNAPFVRQYIADREITAWFLLDLSPSMAFGALQRQKETVLIDFVATMARLLTREGNKVAAIFYNNKIERTIPPRGGVIQVLRLIHELLNRQPSKASSLTDLSPLLEAALNSIKRHSVIFLISDFIVLPGWERRLNSLGRRHDLVPIRLWDPREVELPDVGLLLLEDSESGTQLTVDTRDKKFRRRFKEVAERREAELNRTFKRAGLEAMDLSTEEDLVRAILRFAALRKLRGKRSR